MQPILGPPQIIHECCICYNKPKLFGILENCDHIFCYECIMKWRETESIPISTRLKCPICRKTSKKIFPHKEPFIDNRKINKIKNRIDSANKYIIKQHNNVDIYTININYNINNRSSSSTM